MRCNLTTLSILVSVDIVLTLHHIRFFVKFYLLCAKRIHPMNTRIEAGQVPVCLSMALGSSQPVPSYRLPHTQQRPDERVAPGAANTIYHPSAQLYAYRPHGLGILGLLDRMPYDHNDIAAQAPPELQLDSQWSDLYWSDVPCRQQIWRERGNSLWFHDDLQLQSTPQTYCESNPMQSEQEVEAYVAPPTQPRVQQSVEPHSKTSKSRVNVRTHVCQLEVCHKQFGRRADLARHEKTVSLLPNIIFIKTDNY